LRKSLIVAGVATLALSTAGAAYAQAPTDPSIDATASVSPGKSGTKSKPKAIQLKLSVTNNPESKTTAKAIVIKLPSSLKLSTSGLDQCKADDEALIADQSVCSKAKAGSGEAHAKLNPFAPSPAPLDFKVTPYVGKNELLFVLSGAADAVLHGKISGSKLTITITPQLQQPVTNVYSALDNLATTLKKTKGSKSLLTSVGCSSKKHAIGVTVNYAPNPQPASKSSASTTADAKCS
jgi:hypothetical protein